MELAGRQALLKHLLVKLHPARGALSVCGLHGTIDDAVNLKFMGRPSGTLTVRGRGQIFAETWLWYARRFGLAPPGS